MFTVERNEKVKQGVDNQLSHPRDRRENNRNRTHIGYFGVLLHPCTFSRGKDILITIGHSQSHLFRELLLGQKCQTKFIGVHRFLRPLLLRSGSRRWLTDALVPVRLLREMLSPKSKRFTVSTWSTKDSG